MSLLRLQLRQERTGILGWGIGLLVMAFAVGAGYAAIADDTEQFEEAFESFGGIEDAFGVDSLTSPDGYFKSNAVALYPLLLGIYGGLAATKLYAGAQEQGRIDHVLARPVSRLRYLFTSGGSLALGQLVILAAAALGALLGYLVADQPAKAVGGVVLMTLEVIPLALAHIALAVLASTLFATRGPAVGTVMGIVVGGFALDLIGKLVSALDWLQYLNLYGYWSRSDWYNGDVDGWYLLVSLLVFAGATALAAWRFESKDL